MQKEIISEEIYEDFKEEKLIDYNKIKTSADLLVVHFAYIFDFNYKESLDILKEKGYIDSLYKKFTFDDEKTMQKYNDIYIKAKDYMEKRINN